MNPVMWVQKYHFSLKKRKLRFVKMSRLTSIQKGNRPSAALLRSMAEWQRKPQPVALPFVAVFQHHQQ